ncbi:MAG: ferritin family protein [Magnetococcales bacterium]|nr:ferritin family protein [Magnetococcales bacterium]
MKKATDVFKKALLHEVHGQYFYQKASEITKNDASRMVFLELVDMEDGHARELVEKAKSAPCAKGFNPEAYLRELEATVEARISGAMKKVLRKGKIRKVLALAIDMEKRARANYEKLAEKATDADVKKYCRELAQEEKKHQGQLQQLLNSLDMDLDDRPGL